jgi:FHS family Na+ dependent glucose MFS transporter 1
LRERTGASVGAISVLFVSVAVGYLAGSIGSGRGYDREFGHVLMAGALVLQAAALVAVAWAPTLAALALVYVVVGFAGGAVDVGGNTLLVWAKGHQAPPFLNALHLSFGAGALLAPLVVNRALAWTGGVGAAFVAVAVPSVVAAAVLSSRPSPPGASAEDHRSGGHAPRALLAVIAMFFFLYVGVEVGFGGWVYTYAQEIGLGGANGPAALTAAFWGSFTLGRLMSVWLAHRLPPVALLGGSCALAVAAAALLVVAGGAAGAVWVGTVLFGFGTAPQFATMIAFAERHLPLTGEATSWFLGAAGLGSFAMPWLIGQLLDRNGATAMPWAVLAAAVATLVWFAVVRRALARRLAVVGRRPAEALH